MTRYWTSRNDSNHSSRHAEAQGIQFCAFPYQSYLSQVNGKYGAMIGNFYGRNGETWAANIYVRDGKKEPTLYHQEFLSKDDAFEWAAGKLLELGCTPH